MERNALPRKKMVFVCANLREDGSRICCADGGGRELHAKLKEMVKNRRLRSKVRVCKSGCMDRCEQGPNVMVFPDDMWYSGVTEADLETILADIQTSLNAESPAVPSSES
ncbi:MAG: (2Fe-2S) ferredoxin domain-containing protein [bacterium]|nr:(2Fe-2S) ferredoxin domain-containing protein [bacterium]